jgi:Zn-dependent protease with chaperone function
MASEEDQKAIHRVLVVLKAKGVIAEETVLKSMKTDWWLDFGADRITPVIYYNERYSSLEESLLRFALSHEQYHLMNTKNWVRLSAAYAACSVAAFLSMVEFLDILGLALIPVVLVLLWFVLLRMFGTALRTDETKADLHAARTLIEKFETDKPSVVAMSLFKTLRETPRNRTALTYRVRRFFYTGLHPTDEERVRAIKSLEESTVRSSDR